LLLTRETNEETIYGEKKEQEKRLVGGREK